MVLEPRVELLVLWCIESAAKANTTGQRNIAPLTLPSSPVKKADIVARVADQAGIQHKEAATLVDHVLAAVKSTLEAGDTVQIQNFGKFVVRDKAPRPGRNPRTGEPIWIPARRVLSFKSSRKLNEALSRAG